jgi:hypothetical protein
MPFRDYSQGQIRGRPDLHHSPNQRGGQTEGESAMSLGPELVVNGTFDTDASGWTISMSTTVLSGRLKILENGTMLQSTPSSEGVTYQVQFEIINFDAINGAIELSFGYDASELIMVADGVGVKTFNMVCSGVGLLLLSFSNIVDVADESVTIDNVSVREVLADDAGGIMTDLPDDLWGW